MKALVTNDYGPPTLLTLAETAKPAPGPGQIVVKVAAASVNPFDVKLISGWMRDFFPLTFPSVIGMDCAGTVVEVGSDVTNYKVGDEVFGMLRETPGTVAEYAVANAASPLIAKKPAGLDATRASALPEVGMTSLTLLRASGLRAGERALVIGASGGIGMVLVPLAAAAGAEVLATANADDAEYVRRLGAAGTIDYTQGDTIAETCRRYPDGVDVIFNLIHDGEKQLPLAGALKSGGRLVSALPGPPQEAFGRADITVSAVFLAAEPGDLEDLGAKVVKGAIPVEISAVYPFARAADAYVDYVSKHTRGKLVIAIA